LYYQDEEGDDITINCDEDLLALVPGTVIVATNADDKIAKNE
jgi:hypothetical protein